MNHSLPVGESERPGNLAGIAGNLLEEHAAFGHQVCEGQPFDKFHGDISAAVLFPQIVHGGDVWVV